MKRCAKCRQFKKITEFNNNRNKKDGLCIYCRECQGELNKKYYHEVGKEKQIERVRKYNHDLDLKIRYFILSFLQSHSCIDCGESDPIVLEFDHVLGIKLFSISEFMVHTHSLRIVKEEIEKCVVRCSNCHKKRHALENSWYFDLLKLPVA